MSIDPDKVNSILQHPIEIEPAQYEWLSPTVVPIAEKMERLCSNKGVPSPTTDDAEHAPIQTHDPVNHPSHYTYGTIETIDYIEDKG